MKTRFRTPLLALALLPVLAQAGDIRRHVGDGMASYYSNEFAGSRTANGERFDPAAFTAAHRSLAFHSRVAVTNLANGKEVIVRINDRGPFKPGRVIDLSERAAEEIGMTGVGLSSVRLEVLGR